MEHVTQGKKRKMKRERKETSNKKRKERIEGRFSLANKNRKEKVWERKNMAEKQMLSFWTCKKEDGKGCNE